MSTTKVVNNHTNSVVVAHVTMLPGAERDVPQKAWETWLKAGGNRLVDQGLVTLVSPVSAPKPKAIEQPAAIVEEVAEPVAEEVVEALAEVVEVVAEAPVSEVVEAAEPEADTGRRGPKRKA